MIDNRGIRLLISGHIHRQAEDAGYDRTIDSVVSEVDIVMDAINDPLFRNYALFQIMETLKSIDDKLGNRNNDNEPFED